MFLKNISRSIEEKIDKKLLPILSPTFVQSTEADLNKRLDGVRSILTLSSVQSLHKR
jgi:hypothetical protein